MDNNYTALKIKKQSHFFSKKNLFYFFSIGFALTSFLFFLYATFVIKENKLPAVTTQANQSKRIINFRYEKIDRIPFVVNNIDGLETHGKKYLDYLKELNPQIEEEALRKEINLQILIFYVLNKQTGSKNDYPLNYDELLNINRRLKDEYDQELTRYTGYYLKIRYRGYYGEKENEIKKYFGETDLENLAKEKINRIIEANSNPPALYPELNSDEEIVQLNNQEEVIVYFENETFENPPFDDPLFYQYLTESPLNQYSQLFQLKTTNPFQEEKETYAYLVFFITDKTGNNLSSNYLIYQALNEANYR
jgi:hypothetical protein